MLASSCRLQLHSLLPSRSSGKVSNEPLDKYSLENWVWQRKQELNQALEPLPGVLDYLDAAETMGLKLEVASSSRRDWVEGHLARLGLLEGFEDICTKEDRVQQI